MFASITKTDRILPSPAAINRRTGDLYVSSAFYQLPRLHQKFVLLHELAHWKLNTKSELVADRAAVLWLAKNGEPLSDTVAAVYKVLDLSRKAHQIRAFRAIQAAVHFDKITNPTRRKLHSKKDRMATIQDQLQQTVAALDAVLKQGDFERARDIAEQFLSIVPDTIEPQVRAALDGIFTDYHTALYNGEDIEGYAGEDIEHYAGEDIERYAGGDICSGFTEELEMLGDDLEDEISGFNSKKQARADLIKAKAEAKRLKAQAELEAAKNGIAPKSGAGEAAGKLMEGVGKLAGKFLGIGGENKTDAQPQPEVGQPAPPQTTTEGKQPEEKKTSVWMWVGIGTAILIVIALLVYFFWRKKA